MNIITIVLTAFALAMDAFAVSVTKGMALKNLTKSIAIKIALFFGVFQAAMPLIGWMLGISFQGLVTGSGPAAVRDAARVGDLLELMGKQDIRLIVNRVDKSMLSTVRLTIDDVMDSAGLPLIGIVPEDCEVTLAASFGRPLLKHAPRSPAARAYRNIAKRIQGYHEPITLK